MKCLKKTAGCLVCILIAILILSGCGGDKQAAEPQVQPGTQAQGQPQTQTVPTSKSMQTVPGQTSEPEKADDYKGIVCVSYEAYSDAWGDFSKHINGQSGNHEIVSVHRSTAMPLEQKSLNYLLPLYFLGQSQTSLGEFDATLETTMLQGGWTDELVYNF